MASSRKTSTLCERHSFIVIYHVHDLLLQHSSVHFFPVLVKGLYQTESHSLRDLKVWKNVKVYYKWGWNKSPFDINSVVFHFDDFNYGRRSQPYCFWFDQNYSCIIMYNNRI
jgi:hypothetical protein